MSLFDLSGKVAVITGSTKGIGRSIATEMARVGAKVVISSRKPDACREVAAQIQQAGGEALAIPANISHRDQLQGLIDETIKMWSRIDILVCNAAVNPYYGPLAGISDEAFDKTMDSNVRSNLWLCNMTIPQMAKRREGAVVIVSSIAGVRGSGVIGAYSVTKAADMALARCLAVEWGPMNIRVNCIAPGVVRTDLARARWADEDKHAELVKTYPLGRIGEPEDISGAAIFLASRAGRFVTGQTIFVDGGVTIAGG